MSIYENIEEFQSWMNVGGVIKVLGRGYQNVKYGPYSV